MTPLKKDLADVVHGVSLIREDLTRKNHAPLTDTETALAHFINAHHAEIAQNAADVEVYKNLLGEAHEFHAACIKDAYEKLGIDGSDGEYRYKWVALELAGVKQNAKNARRLAALDQAMREKAAEYPLAALGLMVGPINKRAAEIMRGGE